MLFSGTKENRALADATISRLRAEAGMEATRATLFKVGGYSAFVVCLGLGFGAAFSGYASIKKAHSSSEEIANILAKAISNSSITAKGEVKLLPGAIVSVKPDATVVLDPAASVKLEPGQNVRAEHSSALPAQISASKGDNQLTHQRPRHSNAASPVNH